jgi:DNA-binding GntR family transcriptional regulator
MTNKPKYLLIYEWLSKQIESRKYRPGDRIPSEHELAAMFKVHRMTIRQAIDKLVEDHLLVRRRHSGTFLLSEKSPTLIRRSLENISTYYDDIKQAGLDPAYKMLEAKVIPATETEVAKLGVQAGDPVLSIYRMIVASTTPLVLERCYLPGNLFPGLIDRNLDTALYDMMKDYQIVPHFALQEIGAVLPNLSERRLLKVKETCPCIQIESLTFDQSGRPIELALALHRGDKYRFRCSIGKVEMYERK